MACTVLLLLSHSPNWDPHAHRRGHKPSTWSQHQSAMPRCTPKGCHVRFRKNWKVPLRCPFSIYKRVKYYIASWFVGIKCQWWGRMGKVCPDNPDRTIYTFAMLWAKDVSTSKSRQRSSWLDQNYGNGHELSDPRGQPKWFIWAILRNVFI